MSDKTDRIGVPRSLVTLAARRYLMLDYTNDLSRRLNRVQQDMIELQRRNDSLLRLHRNDLNSVRRQKVELEAQLANKDHTVTQLQEYCDWLIKKVQTHRSNYHILQQRYHLLQVQLEKDRHETQKRATGSIRTRSGSF